jgi:predicted transcriptional regulator
MASSEFLENYRRVEPTIRKLYDSSLRLAILDALKDGPLRLADLRRAVNANAPNTSSKAKELEAMGLLEKVDEGFKLTTWGQAVIVKIRDSIDFYTTYENLKEFWETRDISVIPEHLWARIWELKGCKIVKAEEPEVMKTHEECIKIMQSPKKELFGMGAVFRPVYLQIAQSLVKENLHAEFLITDKVLEKVSEHLTPEIAAAFDNYENHVFFVNNKINFALKVSESWFYLILRSKAAGVDMMGMNIQSHDPAAIKWGRDLYDYYKKDAKPVKLSDYL